MSNADMGQSACRVANISKVPDRKQLVGEGPILIHLMEREVSTIVGRHGGLHGRSVWQELLTS